MLDFGLFWVSNIVQGNEFIDINEGTDIEKMLLKYGIKAENQRLRNSKNFSKKLIF
jgi:hypothetical protein